MQTKISVLRKCFPFILFGAVLGAAASCNKKAESTTPSLPGNEFLTTVQLKLVNQANPADTPVCEWTQMSPTTHTYQPDSAYFNKAVLNLKANSVYNGIVMILDETKTPFDTVTYEIEQRQNYHLLYFQPSPILASNIIISNTSTDIPTSYWITGDATDTTYGGISINEVSLSSASAGNPLNLVVSRTDMDSNNPPMQIGLMDSFTTGAASSGTLRCVQRHQPNAKNGTYPPGSTDFDITYAVNIH